MSNTHSNALRFSIKRGEILYLEVQDPCSRSALRKFVERDGILIREGSAPVVSSLNVARNS